MIWFSQPSTSWGLDPGSATAGAPLCARDAQDHELVERAAEGDDEALDELATRYRDRVLGIARGYVRDHADAEDICQETLMTLLTRIGECRQPEAFAGWVAAIARNRAISFLRRRAARPHVSLDAVAELSDRSDPLRDTEDAELRDRLGPLIDALPGLQRHVLVLFDLEGMRHGEISERLGISEGAARVHLHTARRKLRDRLSAPATRRTES